MLLRTEPRHARAAAFLAAVLSFGAFCLGQESSKTGSLDAGEAVEAVLPETGVLTPHDYRNVFYSFSLDLPESAERVPLRTRIMQRGGHALLAMSFRDGNTPTEVAISSFDSSSSHVLDPAGAAKRVVADAERKHIAFDLRPQLLHFKNGSPFHYVEIYRYSEKRITCHLFFSVQGHLLQVTASSTAERAKFKAWLIGALHFGDAVITLDARSYLGPTIPDAVVERKILDKPGRRLPADIRVNGLTFINATTGLQYRIPAGWKVMAPSAPEPPEHFEVIAQDAAVVTRQRLLFRACSRTLLRLAGPTASNWRTDHSANGIPRLRLLALDPGCLQLSFPKAGDAHAAADFSRALLEYPDFEEVRSSEFTDIAGEMFYVVRSLLPDETGADGLRHRLTQTAYVVERNGQLLVWFFSARIESAIPRLDGATLDFTTSK